MSASHGRRPAAEASGVDAGTGPSARSSLSHQRSASIEGLKEHLFQWDDHENSDGENVSEHELLMDPQDPDDDYGEGIELENGGVRKRRHEEEDSPYAEVRVAVRNYDEDLPCNTVRAWVIGLCLVVLGASMNTLFSLRRPSISIGPLVAQIIAWPIGHAWARFMPTRDFTTFGRTWTLNPGPFNIKEHSIIGVMASVSFSVAYSTDIILAQLIFYKQDFGYLFQLLLTISTQSLGYGIAGSMRKFLGEPTIDTRPTQTHNCSTNTMDSVSCVHDMAGQPCGRHHDECHV